MSVRKKLEMLRIEEERDENKVKKGRIFYNFPLPITSAEDSRVLKLKRILNVLKERGSSLLNPTPLLLPTFDEHRIYQLISCHLSYCIFLFNRESSYSQLLLQQQQHQESSPYIVTAIPFPNIDDDYDKNQENLEDLKEDEFDFLFQLHELANLLKECRSSVGVPPINEEISTSPHPCCELRKHQLLNILLDLEEMASSRQYAPPNHGPEIECYEEIHKHVAFFLTRIYAHIEYALGIYPSVSPDRRIFSFTTRNEMLTCRLPGHKFALAFELIPHTRTLLQLCKHQLLSVFSNDNNESDNYDGETDSCGIDDTVGIGYAERNPLAVVKSRIDCLRIIVSKFDLVGQYPSDSLPTIKEVRLYAQIAAHVHSTIWISSTVMEVERNTDTGGGCHEVNVASVKDLSCSSSAVPDSKGDYTSIRERYLLDIVSYLSAIRSSCALAIPTSEELEYYEIIAERLNGNLFSFSFPFGNAVRRTDKTEMVISGELISVLRHHLDSIDRSRLKFLSKLNELCASIINMIRCLVMSNENIEDLSYKDAVHWLWYDSNSEQLGNRLKEFSRVLPVGRIDRAIVILEVITSLICDISQMLNSATRFTDSQFKLKKYEIVAAEVHHALLITGKIKHLIFETI